MADRNFRLPRPQPEPTAYHPTTSKIRIERQGTVNQLDGCIDVFTKITEYVRSPAKNAGVVAGDPKRPPSETDRLAAVQLSVVGPAVDVEILMALRCCRESSAVTRIALNRPLEERERGDGPRSVPTVQMQRARRYRS